MRFNFHSTNPVLLALEMMLNFGLGILVWGGWIMWVTGLRLSKAKRTKFKYEEQEFRAETKAKWEEYRRKNTREYIGTINHFDSNGNFMRSSLTSWVESPGRRSTTYLFIIVILSYIFCYLFEKITDYNSYVGIFVYLSSGYFIWWKFRKHLLYDQWYMRVIYSVAIYVTFFVSFLQIIDSFEGLNKI